MQYHGIEESRQSMNVFKTHARIVEDYATYIRSFLNIADPQFERSLKRNWGEESYGPNHFSNLTLRSKWQEALNPCLGPAICMLTPLTSSRGTRSIDIKLTQSSWEPHERTSFLLQARDLVSL